MSSELERRLDGLLAEAPEPEPEVGEEALARALSALQPAAGGRRGLRTAVLVFGATALLLAITAGALAAAGALHVSFGKQPRPRREAQLTLPRGADGVLALVAGHLSVVTKSGFRLQGLPVTAAARSPHALYVAAGIGSSLVALKPDGHEAWSHPAGGTVAAIAWAPDGLRIAYVVHVGSRLALHVIWGNGTHDSVLDRSVRAVQPSWRADSLALAYVGAGGSPVLYDLAHRSRRLVAVNPPATGVSFAPTGEALAVEHAGGISLVATGGRPTDVADGTIEAFGWLSTRLAVAVPGIDSALIRRFSASGASRGSRQVYGIVVAITPTFVIVERNGDLVAGNTTFMTVPRDARIHDLVIR